jgi:hypothetical protein
MIFVIKVAFAFWQLFWKYFTNSSLVVAAAAKTVFIVQLFVACVKNDLQLIFFVTD